MTLEDTIRALQQKHEAAEVDVQALRENRATFDAVLLERYVHDLKDLEPFIKLIVEQAKQAEQLGFKYCSSTFFRPFKKSRYANFAGYHVTMSAHPTEERVLFHFDSAFYNENEGWRPHGCRPETVGFGYETNWFKRKRFVVYGKARSSDESLPKAETIEELACLVVRHQKHVTEHSQYENLKVEQKYDGIRKIEGGFLASLPIMLTHLPTLIVQATTNLYDTIKDTNNSYKTGQTIITNNRLPAFDETEKNVREEPSLK